MARNSNNLEGPLFSGPYNKMERSSSFREGLETRATGASRNVQQPSEIPPLTQYLDLEPVPMREQQQPKSRLAELRRVLGTGTGTGLDDHGFGSVQSKAATSATVPEELKRFKASLLETSARAGENAKFFQGAITKVDKYKSIVSKRRQRSSSDTSGDKPGSSNFSKIGGSHSNSPAHQILPGEHLGQRQEDRPKNLVPNKRARSSLGESRSEGRGVNSMRQALTNTEKEKSTTSCSRLAGNEGPTPSEEKPRGLTPGGDGWEKKLKRKRSMGSMVNRVNDGAHGDSNKQSAAPLRPNISTDNRPRSNDNNGHGFRSGPLSGNIGGNKTDGSSQQSCSNGSRSSVKAENDNPSERREQRSSALDKDRNMQKGNKLVSRDEPQAGAVIPIAKTKASRAPRTNSFVVMNSSPSFPRFPGSSTDGWDPPAPSNKVQNATTPPGPTASSTAPVTTNRKRPLPSNPPSPPVAQWVGQRPQKIQRTRRANVISPVSNFDEIQASNDGSALSPSVSIQKTTRGDAATSSSPAGLSESEESSKGKGVENGETADNNNKGFVSTNNKKANRVLLKEEIGDGVRRQGRSTGRGGGGPAQGRSLPPLPKEKMDGCDGAIKPPKTGRPASDRNDSRIGRPPLKKAVDRKSQGRMVQNPHILPSDMTGELDDDKEELMAAINAARIACSDACTGPFWKKMEPVFCSASDDLTFLKNQIAFVEALDKSASEVLVDGYNHEKNSNIQEKKAPSELLPSSHKPSAIGSLSQMLLSAFISIDGSELLLDPSTCTQNGNSEHFSYDKGGQCNGFLDESLLTSSHCQMSGPHSQNHEIILNSTRPALYECHYEDMSLDDRILLELHSIGIYPDTGPELGEGGGGAIDTSASKLQNELAEKVKEKKSIMQILDKAFHDAKRTEERHLEQLAMDKLVERACKKLLGGRGGSSHKGGGISKLSKQLAQAFAKRTLDRCHKFDESGHSCFSSDPALCDSLFAPLQRLDPKQQPDGVNERRKLDRGPSDGPDQAQMKTDQASNRLKKREVLLDEVSRGTTATSAFGPKWKKSDHSTKNSNPNTTTAKGGGGGGRGGERKNKTKPKQKMAHLSSSQNGINRVITGNGLGQQKTELPGTTTSDMNNDSLFAGLPMTLDDLDDDVAGDAADLGSWLNVDDESLQDIDLVGLQIPMDDLADLTFN